jgi:hypothetical protein
VGLALVVDAQHGKPQVPHLRVDVGAATKGVAGLEVKRDGLAIRAGQWGILGIVAIVKSSAANGTTACTGPATMANVNGCNALRDAARAIQTGGIAVRNAPYQGVDDITQSVLLALSCRCPA